MGPMEEIKKSGRENIVAFVGESVKMLRMAERNKFFSVVVI